ncbi:hypothetical protein, partial [Atopomonas hussainii]|uniref:hypothetical protein n=1 Tax=Atopomonas hussainii TaxID=1429083 RepID=UPI001C319E3F
VSPNKSLKRTRQKHAFAVPSAEPRCRLAPSLGFDLMRSVDDIFQSEIGFGPGHQIEIEGWLVVAKPLSYLTASESKEENAILVIAPGLYEQFLDQLAVRCGTMVGFAGTAKITGRLSKTGLSPLPYAIYKIDTLTFQERDGSSAIYIPEKSEEHDWFDL